MKIPEASTPGIAAMIDAAHEVRRSEKHENVFRPHMGASMLGEKCDRKMWLAFRWAVREAFPGRILRVFRRGQNEEAIVVEDLRAIGCKVRATGGDQTRVDFGSHVSGSIDGIITAGVPEAPKKAHILEMKTHSRKNFDALKDGVQKAHPKHWTQMQVYMLGTGIDRALYVAVCKDDDAIYTERVRLDREAAMKAVDRGRRLATQDEVPPPLSTDPSWYECKWCSAHDFCHGSKLTKEVNCRTCAHSTAKPDGTWHCERHSEPIPTDAQRMTWSCHALHYDLVPWHVLEVGDDGTPTFGIDGHPVVNGAEGFASEEIVANPRACVDATIVRLRRKFDGRILG